MTCVEHTPKFNPWVAGCHVCGFVNPDFEIPEEVFAAFDEIGKRMEMATSVEPRTTDQNGECDSVRHNFVTVEKQDC